MQHSFSVGALHRLAWCGVAAALLGTVQAEGLRERVDQALEQLPHPQSAAAFQPVAHLPCRNQGATLVCWSFATSSFFESEMARLKLQPVRLSVMYTVYCQYLEKARQFVATKGASRFTPGDVFCGGLDVFRQYGALPAELFDREVDGKARDQHPLYAELETFMNGVKQKKNWNEAAVLAGVKKILNRHLGEPPKSFSFQSKTYTPKSFLTEVVRLPWNDYVMITSFESAPFNTFTELKVPDNWRHNTNFFNVPLPVFYEAFKGALKNGYSVAVSVDTSEPTYEMTGRHCWIPNFDLPSDKIDQDARELRFQDGATSDDHAIHIIGYSNCGGEDWFMAKDSWRVAWRNENKGCLFLHSSYVKLKVLAFIVPRQAVPQVTATMGGPGSDRASETTTATPR
jgi:bleomycin hydrolase